MMRVHKVRDFVVFTLKGLYFMLYYAAQHVSLSLPGHHSIHEASRWLQSFYVMKLQHSGKL